MNFDFEMDDYAVQVIIQPWALEELRRRPELINLTQEHLGGEPTEER